MASLKDISVVVEGAVTESRAIRSGEKYVTPQGFTAIRTVRSSVGGERAGDRAQALVDPRAVAGGRRLSAR